MRIFKMAVLIAGCWILGGIWPAAAQQATTRAAKAPRELTPEELRKGFEERFATMKGRPSVKKRNPNVGQSGIRPSLLFTLQQQKLAAVMVHPNVAGPASPQSAGAAPRPGGQMLSPSRPLLLNNPGNGGSVVPQTAPVPANSPALSKSQPTSLGPTHTMGATTTRVTQPPPLNVNPKTNTKNGFGVKAPAPLVVCLGPGIRAVNQRVMGIVFTPIQDYNAYTITGCSFGTQSGHAYLIGKFRAQQVNLQIQYWNDTEIDARVDPAISGELDLDNVSLVVAPVQGPQIKASGFKFMAARSDSPVFLPNIPSSWVKLDSESVKINNFVSKPVKPSYTSPGGGSMAPQDAVGDTAYVSRYYPGHSFPTGADFFDFSHLAPGWTTDSMQMSSYDQDVCPYIVTYRQTSGNAFPEWKGDNIRVFWTATSCSGFMPSPLGIPLATYSNNTGSYYALNVWVRGPRCTDPYTGVAQHQCIQNVTQCGRENCGN